MEVTTTGGVVNVGAVELPTATGLYVTGSGSLNTDITGGTRFSAGKPKLVATPLLGLGEVRGLCGGPRWKWLPVEEHVERAWVGYEQAAVEPWPALPWIAAHTLAALHFLEGGWPPSGTPTTRAPWPILGLFEVGRVSEYGAGKYALFDWEVGQSLSTLLNCLGRHLVRATVDPRSRDAESGLLHLGHAGWNALAALHFDVTGRNVEVDDVTPWKGVVTADRELARERIANTMAESRRARTDTRNS